jgi:hypothetical protein
MSNRERTAPGLLAPQPVYGVSARVSFVILDYMNHYCPHRPRAGYSDEKVANREISTYSDEKVANRDIRVWHLVIENGY